MISLKKLMFLLLLIMGLYGCQQENAEMKLGEIYDIEDQLQFEIIKTNATTDIMPSNKNRDSQYITSQDNHIFIDCLVKVSNLSTTPKTLLELLSGQYQINNQSYDLQMILETENYNKLTTTDTIKPNQERYVHLYCETMKENVNQTITLYVKLLNQHDYQYTITMKDDVVSTTNRHSLGDVISLDESQITLNQMSQSKKIEPSNKGIFYSYIPTDDKDETFVYLQIDIHNLSNHTIKLNDYLYCEYMIKDQSYPAQMIMETENHKTLEKAEYIESLQTRTLYLAFPIKDNLLKEKGIFKIFVEGQTYQIERNYF